MNASLASQSAEEQDRLLLALSAALVCVLGRGGILRRVNPAWQRVLGWSEAELLGRSTDELIHPDDLRRARANRERTLEQNRGFSNWRVRLRHKDGGYRTVQWTTSPGDADTYYAVGQDVTDSIRGQEELRRAEERYRILFHESPLPRWLYDPETLQFLEVNDAAVAQYGYTRDELLEMRITDLRAPEDLGELDAALTRGDQGYNRMGVLHHRRKDGGRLQVEISAHTVTLGERKVRMVAAYDVTARLAYEAEIERRALVSALAADVGLALTRDGTLHEVLQRCAEALQARLLADCARIWTRPSEHEPFELQASAGACDPREGRQLGLLDAVARRRTPLLTGNLQADPELGDPFWARSEGFTSFAGHPVFIGGEVDCVLALFARAPLPRSVLEGLAAVSDAIALGVRRKLVEEAKEKLEAQLRQSQRMEAIGSLAGGIAHDFNNLMSVVISYSCLLADDLPIADRTRDDLEQIRRAGERAADLTRQLLAFSRRQILQPRIVELNELVTGMAKMLRRVIGEGIELATVASPEPATANLDPTQVEQVIMNLAVNARDAMPNGGKLSIEVSHVALDETYTRAHAGVVPGPYVLLAVSDTGTGMDEALRARIFEPFFTTKEAGKGTGLGLATVFGIVRQSGGHLWVYSEPGHGSTFKVYFPAAGGVPANLTAGTESERLRGSETVLLVEDEEAVRTLARTILARAGYEVLEAQSGADALLICEQPGLQVDLLLTDMVMPRMSGATLVQRLLAKKPSVRVLFMSGYAESLASDHGITAGALFLQKPFSPQSLLGKVREALREQPQAAAPPARRRVLLVDDEKAVLRLLARALSEYEIAQHSDPAEALALLRAGARFDAIVSDVYMPGMTGADFQRALAEVDSLQAGRMLFLSGALPGPELGDFAQRNAGRILRKPLDLAGVRAEVARIVESR